MAAPILPEEFKQARAVLDRGEAASAAEKWWRKCGDSYASEPSNFLFKNESYAASRLEGFGEAMNYLELAIRSELPRLIALARAMTALDIQKASPVVVAATTKEA
jgi:hypothetical protein